MALSAVCSGAITASRRNAVTQTQIVEGQHGIGKRADLARLQLVFDRRQAGGVDFQPAIDEVFRGRGRLDSDDLAFQILDRFCGAILVQDVDIGAEVIDADEIDDLRTCLGRM